MSEWGMLTEEEEAANAPLYGGAMTAGELAAWLNRRCGRLTGSRVYDALHRLKKGSGYSTGRLTLLKSLLAERMTGESVDHFVSAPMKWGLQQEPNAKMAYEVQTGYQIQKCGFILHPTIEDFGATPDGLIDHDGCLEIKCPNTDTFLDFRVSQTIPVEYEWQMAAQLACTGRKWCDFVMYDPRVKRMENIIIQRFTPHKVAWIDMVELEAKAFLDELDRMWEILIHSPLPEAA